jgi:hypothetical protein
VQAVQAADGRRTRTGTLPRQRTTFTRPRCRTASDQTIFLCRYLQSEALRREIQEGLNVIENWNGANSFILYGKGGEIATNHLENQELTMLALHLLQICLVYINTLMIQRVLTEPDWTQRMLPDDLRALTPLIYTHVTPYGIFRLDMNQRLAIEEDAIAA